MELWMKPCPVTILDTMWRPQPAVLLKTDMGDRMPVARSVNGDALGDGGRDPTIQHRHHIVALFDRQGAARTEIVLDINNNKCITRLKDILRRIQHLARTSAVSGWTESIETVEPRWTPTFVSASDTHRELMRAAILASSQRYHQL